MTSRFGKTYSRKGGDGSSKFDEVFSSKRTTHSTKWGETTFMAKVGQKRPIFKPASEIPKKPKVTEEITEDPFGFDSDEDSAPVTTSKILPQPKGASQQPVESLTSDKPENLASSELEVNDCTSESRNTGNTLSCKFISFDSALYDLNETKADSVLQDGKRDNRIKCSTTDKQHNLNQDEKNNSSYENAKDDCEKLPVEMAAIEQNAAVQVQDETSDLHAGKRSQSPSGISRTQESFRTTLYDWDEQDHEDLKTDEIQVEFNSGNLETKKQVDGVTNMNDEDHTPEAFGDDDYDDDDDDDELQTVVKLSNCRTYCRPNKGKQSHGTADFDKVMDGTIHSVTKSDESDKKHMELSDDPYGLPEELKKAKPGEKSKEGARKIFNAPKRSPTKAVYNARHWNQPESETLPAPPLFLVQNAAIRPSSNEVIPKDDGVFKAPAPPPKVIKTVTIPTQPYQDIVTALKCRKEHKELYTVVQHVKHFNDVVEFGENQEFTDDIEYLLSGLKSTQPINTRCLSVISLATKCAMPSFRMHLRANGMVAMVFKTLDDTHHHQNLALCTASLMYILSRDRLNMDLDRASLDLMIKLLEMDIDPDAMQLNEKDMNKIKEKIRKLCETVHNKHLDLENITTGHLAMETLLSLTSKRAGDWFKEELRLLGGLDHIVDKVKECVDHLSIDESEEKLVASLWGAERCLRVLESVTVHNPENQSYLIAYKDSQLIAASAKALQHCEQFVQRYNRAEDSICCVDTKSLPQFSVTNHVGKAVEDCMRAIIGVLLNLTNDNEWGSTKTGEQEDLIATALSCVLQVPQYLPQEQRFDIRVLGLGLLINLVEYSARNRHCLVNMETTCSYDSFCGEERVRTVGQLDAVHALVQLFLERQRAAQLAESQTDELIKEVPTAQHDKSGEWQESGGEIQWVASEKSSTDEPEKKEEEDEELDLNKALQHAGKHMEDCIVSSYTALLLGCLCQESPMNVTTVRKYLPQGDFSIMTEMLQKFLSFMNLTCAVGTTGQKSISRVIEYLENC
ncbi:wings apart-like protein homolog isoform X4 [Pleurodeles waltl]|uniref:wings apart-like protein homolog isoform X4 n=1 Tax=Pleurodeles waltl TaxID=8319 RepID=UPI00370983C5